MESTVIKPIKQNSENSQDSMFEETITKLSYYVEKIIKEEFPHQEKIYFDDMYQSGVYGIILSFSKYQNEETVVEEFFRPYIINEIQTFVA